MFRLQTCLTPKPATSILMLALIAQIVPMLFMNRLLRILGGTQILIIFGASLLLIDLVILGMAIKNIRRAEIYLTG